MNKKENRMAVRQTVEKAVLRDEQNQRIQFAAANPVQEVLKSLHTTLRGLDAEAVAVSRTKYGSNKVTHEKEQSLAKRLAGAFINPFTAILFCLAVVSTMTDMVFPYFALLGSAPEDFDPLTVVIISTMVIISGTLRFVQESRSGKAAGNDNNDLYRHSQRAGKDRNSDGRFGCGRHCAFGGRGYDSCGCPHFRGEGLIHQPIQLDGRK